jgi:crotonobetainyl-CoA:carnitine CoA-transferase CaiB-like acyl-CoA transferase
VLLEGIRIMSLAEQYPGPLATMVLADLGADVIMVERPAGGDPVRAKPLFEGLNRNKRSCCIDLRDPDGQAAALRLARDSHVVIEGFRPGVADRLGVGYEVVRKVNPRVLYARVTGFGETGEYAQRPGHDLSFQAITGMLGRDASGAPGMPTYPLADYITGLFAAIGLIAGLREVERTGESLSFDLAMIDALLTINGPSFTALLNGLTPVHHPPLDPGYGIFQARDGRYVALSITGESHLWAAICTALGVADLASLTTAERIERRDEVIKVIQATIGSLTWDEMESRLSSCDGAFAEVNTAQTALQDKIVQSRQVFVTYGTGADQLTAVRQPLQFAGFEPPRSRSCPRLGADTEAVLAEIGLSPDEIGTLREAGVVGPAVTPHHI